MEVQLLSAAPRLQNALFKRLILALLAGASALLLVFGSAFGLLTLTGKGIVVGGLQPCDALGVSNVRYAAGSVSALQGRMLWGAATNGFRAASFPTRAAAQQKVGTNGVYWFELDPGQYVLRGTYAGGSTVTPWVEVTVNAGSVAYVDIPNMCI